MRFLHFPSLIQRFSILCRPQKHLSDVAWLIEVPILVIFSEAPDSEPLWDSLPVEYHIIVRYNHATREVSIALKFVQKAWNYSSTETIAEQSLRLNRKYLDTDVLEEPPCEDHWTLVCSATQIEIDTILRPWQSLKFRNATRTQSDNMNVPLLLRTHYNPDAAARAKDDAQVGIWVSV